MQHDRDGTTRLYNCTDHLVRQIKESGKVCLCRHGLEGRAVTTNVNRKDDIDHETEGFKTGNITLNPIVERHELRRSKGMMADEARTLMTDPLYYANLMVRLGKADGSVAGATNTTSHTVRAALHCIGVRSGFKIVSSFFLMALPNPAVGYDGALIFADCGVVIEPSAAELAEIAIASADSCRALLGATPRVRESRARWASRTERGRSKRFRLID